MPKLIPNCLSVAGSDPSGGAGIQADLKTFTALGVYGATVITALTAQNTQEFLATRAVEPEFLALQLDSVLAELNFSALKFGMLHDVPIIKVILEFLPKFPAAAQLIIDPVICSSSGARLLTIEAQNSLEQLLPAADLITPNLFEAQALLKSSSSPKNIAEMRDCAQTLFAKYQTRILLKGGHLVDATESCDIFYDGKNLEHFSHPTIYLEPKIALTQTNSKNATRYNPHGSGCTLSAAITAEIAKGQTWSAAITAAKSYLWHALQNNKYLNIDSCHKPLNHLRNDIEW